MPRKKVKKEKPVDENNLPDNITSQGDKADDMIANLQAGKDANATDGDEPVVDPEPAKKLTPTHPTPADPAVPAAPAEPAEPAKPAGGEEPRVDPGSYQTPAAPATEDLATLQHKMSTLEGKYDTEITRLSTALQTSQNIIEQQESLIKNLQTTGGAAAPAADPEPAQKKLNPDDYSSYGSEMESLVAIVNSQMDVIAGLKTQVTANVTSTGTQGGESDRLKKVEDKMNNLGQTVHMSAKQTYYHSLDNSIRTAEGKPDWEAVNKDPKFAQWLSTEEPMTGIARKSILLKANQDLNSERVIAIFSEFKRSQAVMPARQDHTGLGDQIVPEAAASGAGQDVDPNAQKQGLVTSEMLKKAKDDFVQGRIKEADFDKVAAGYQTSIAKGWVQPGQ
jgi:hypothetical protein